MRKKYLLGLMTVLLALGTPATAMAAEGVNMPYYSYTYDETYENAVAVPAPYSIEKTVTGTSLGIGAFNGISDVFYDEAGHRLYLTDSTNNRIIILKEDYSVERVLDSFQNGENVDGFRNPTAVYVKNNLLYVSDTDNHRIVAFDANSLQLEKMINQPEIKLLGDYVFLPKSFSVDLAGRIYVVAENINKGIVQLDAEGNFERFVGAPKVSPSSQAFLTARITLSLA